MKIIAYCICISFFIISATLITSEKPLSTIPIISKQYIVSFGDLSAKDAEEVKQRMLSYLNRQQVKYLDLTLATQQRKQLLEAGFRFRETKEKEKVRTKNIDQCNRTIRNCSHALLKIEKIIENIQETLATAQECSATWISDPLPCVEPLPETRIDYKL